MRRHAEPIPEESRAKLSRMIREARERRGWSQEHLSIEAENALRLAAADFRSPTYVTSEERVKWREIDISPQHVTRMEGCPWFPLGRGDRRARLRGVCLALGLDFAEVNRIAGGL
jgi:hypothetical protein